MSLNLFTQFASKFYSSHAAGRIMAVVSLLLSANASHAQTLIWAGEFSTGGAASGSLIGPSRWVMDSNSSVPLDRFGDGQVLSDLSRVKPPSTSDYIIGKHTGPNNVLNPLRIPDVTKFIDSSGAPVSLVTGESYILNYYVKPTLLSIDGGESTYYMGESYASLPQAEYYTDTGSQFTDITITGTWSPDSWPLLSVPFTALPGDNAQLVVNAITNQGSMILYSGPGSAVVPGRNVDTGVIAVALVPEPSGLLLLGVTGLLSLCARRR